nr:hypothetical protein BaRGS_014844 [Batillaria attramentaria]
MLVTILGFGVVQCVVSWHHGLSLMGRQRWPWLFIVQILLTDEKGRSNSAWSDIGRKLKVMMHFVWPGGNRLLQLIVIFCLILLAGGRVVNVFVPVYGKEIGFLSLRWHLERKTGKVLRIVERGTASMNMLLAQIAFQIIPTLVDCVIAIVFFITTFSYLFGLIILACVTFYIAITFVMTEVRTKYRRSMNKLDNEAKAHAVDSLINFETVKYYGATDFEISRYRDAISKYQVKDAPEAEDLVITEGKIEFQDVCFHYDQNRPILKDINFTVLPGQTYALVGHTGSGKSTIVRLLFRFYDVSSGVIKIDGKNIALNRVFLQCQSMWGNDSADMVFLVSEYETVVGERGLKLSGGEKQRVAIARTLLKAPAIVLLDEVGLPYLKLRVDRAHARNWSQ